jgi:hypothetical protein
MINPFIDPVSREKMKFNPKLVEDKIFTADMLIAEAWGGERNFQYEHEKYWPALVKMCDARRQAWMAAWRAMGGTIGLKEWDYKAGHNSGTSADPEKIADAGVTPLATTTLAN